MSSNELAEDNNKKTQLTKIERRKKRKRRRMLVHGQKLWEIYRNAILRRKARGN